MRFHYNYVFLCGELRIQWSPEWLPVYNKNRLREVRGRGDAEFRIGIRNNYV